MAMSGIAAAANESLRYSHKRKRRNNVRPWWFYIPDRSWCEWFYDAFSEDGE